MCRFRQVLATTAWTFVLATLANTTATAQTFSWNNAAGGSYHSAGNWTPAGGPPGAAHTALFNLAGSYTVSFTAPVTNNMVTQGGGTVNWALGGQTYTVNSSANIASSAGSLTVTNGAVNSNSVNIGNGTAIVGSLVVSTGATWTSQNLAVGGGGSDGTSRLTIQNGGDFITNSGVNIGFTTGAIGRVTVNGAGSTWNHTPAALSILVGLSGGTGSLSVLSGASMSSQSSITVGVVGGNGEFLAQGTGTTVNLTGSAQFSIGTSGAGNARIENGAVVNAGASFIGSNPGGTGTMTVAGLGAQWNTTNSLEIGGTLGSFGDSGSLNIQVGGSVSVGNNTRLWSAGTLNLNGGLLSTSNLVFNGGTMNWTAGQVNFTTNQSLTGTLATNLLGNPTTMGANRTLSVSPGQTLTVSTPFQLDGSQLAGGNVINDNTLVVNSGAVTATSAFTNNANRLLIVQGLGGVVGSTAFNNNGTIHLAGPGTSLSGAGLNNTGLLLGTGTLHNALANGTTGTVRVTGSERLVFTHATNNNSGNLELLDGTLEFRQALTNQATGSISGRGALHTSTAAPGGLGLINNGVMLFSAGTMDIRGDVQNNAGARIVTAGGGVTTFFDDVVHNGIEIRTNAGARTVFFGNQSGAGAFTGVGTVEYNGDTRPGNSPALVSYEGDVEFTFSSRLTIEIGGPTPGSEFDQLSVAGGVFLGGHLNVVFFGGFSPVAGDSFRIIDNAGNDAVVGNFLGLAEGSSFLAGGHELQITYQGGTGNDVMLSVVGVPEPGVLLLLGCVGAGAWGLGRRYRNQGIVEAAAE